MCDPSGLSSAVGGPVNLRRLQVNNAACCPMPCPCSMLLHAPGLEAETVLSFEAPAATLPIFQPVHEKILFYSPSPFSHIPPSPSSNTIIRRAHPALPLPVNPTPSLGAPTLPCHSPSIALCLDPLGFEAEVGPEERISLQLQHSSKLVFLLPS